MITRIVLALGIAGLSLTAQEAEKKAPAKTEAKVEAKAVDPVCGMTVDTKTAEKSVYKGKSYYFCSRSEKAEFDKTPDKFVAKK